MSPAVALTALGIGFLVGGTLTAIYLAMLWHWRDKNGDSPR